MNRVHRFVELIQANRLAALGFALLLGFILMAVFADTLAPYGPSERIREDGVLVRLEPPSREHWFGTTYYGADVFSQTIYASQVSVVVGLVAAIIMTVVGTAVGMLAGYKGGRVDDILMRGTDIAYGVPVLAFAIVVVALTEPSLWSITLALSLLLWRTTARSIRSQLLSLKERPFVWSARAGGASDFRIMSAHLLPNVASLALLFAAIGVGNAVLGESGLSFLGLGDPLKVSWGQMLHFAFISASIRHAWWWVIPPGVSISLFVLAAYVIGRSYEKVMNPRLAGRV